MQCCPIFLESVPKFSTAFSELFAVLASFYSKGFPLGTLF